jgi:hypothetical protein
MLPNKPIQRLLAVAVLIAFVALTTGSVTHVHNAASGEATCQVCHVSHASAPGPSAPGAAPIEVRISKLALVEESSPVIEPYAAPSIPRAPPA